MLNKASFVDLRSSVYALLVDNPALYYHYVKSLLDEFLTESSEADIDRVADLNVILSRVRAAHTSKTYLLSPEVEGLLGSDAARISSVFISGRLTARCHTETSTTVPMPVAVDTVSSTWISSFREALRPAPDLLSLQDGSKSKYVSSAAVAQILGGVDTVTSLIARGTGTELAAFISEYSGPPATLTTRLATGHENSFALTGDYSDTYIDTLGQVVEEWAAYARCVRLPTSGIGTCGPLFEYPLSVRLIDMDLSIRPGMCLADDTSVVVDSVVGERIKLSSPTSLCGEIEFVYKAHAAWSNYLPLLKDITPVGSTDRERAISFAQQVAKRRTACKGLLQDIPSVTNQNRFDIKSAHHALGADYAYNLLERGRLMEYHALTEEQSKRSSVMSTAAAHIRAGARL